MDSLQSQIKNGTKLKKNLRTTGGGPSQEVSLSALEQAAADILKIHLVVDPLGETFGGDNCTTPKPVKQLSPEVQRVLDHVHQLEEDPQQEQDEQPHCSKKPQKPKTKQKNQDIRLDLLDVQTETNKEILATIKKMESTCRDIYRLKRQKFKRDEEENKLRITIKKKKLELLNRKLEKLDGNEL